MRGQRFQSRGMSPQQQTISGVLEPWSTPEAACALTQVDLPTNYV